MSKAVLSSQDIVKELAQCLVKVKTDPLLLPFFLFARSLGATTAACQNGLLIKSPVNSGHIFTATDNNNTKKLYGTTVSLKSFQKAQHETSKKTFLPSFVLAFIILQNTWERWGQSARLPRDSQTLHMTSQQTSTAAQLQKRFKLLCPAATVSSEVPNNTSKMKWI